MPEIVRFVVTQTREVEVHANNITDAVQIANAAFEHGQNMDGSVKIGKGPFGIWGNTTSKIQVTDVQAHDLRPKRGR